MISKIGKRPQTERREAFGENSAIGSVFLAARISGAVGYDGDRSGRWFDTLSWQTYWIKGKADGGFHAMRRSSGETAVWTVAWR
jgi:hypothetical protein